MYLSGHYRALRYLCISLQPASRDLRLSLWTSLDPEATGRRFWTPSCPFRRAPLWLGPDSPPAVHQHASLTHVVEATPPSRPIAVLISISLSICRSFRRARIHAVPALRGKGAATSSPFISTTSFLTILSPGIHAEVSRERADDGS
jgi:hypothetical protein